MIPRWMRRIFCRYWGHSIQRAVARKNSYGPLWVGNCFVILPVGLLVTFDDTAMVARSQYCTRCTSRTEQVKIAAFWRTNGFAPVVRGSKA